MKNKIILGNNCHVDERVILGQIPRDTKIDFLNIGNKGTIRSGTIIYLGVKIGDNFQSGHHVMIRENNIIGNNVSVGTNVVLEPGNQIGNNVRIHTGCFLENVTLKDGVFVGPNTVFTDDPHPMCPRYEDCLGGAVVEKNVSIGANCTILPGIKIGEGALIGAGSVVTHDVVPFTVVAGNPAKKIKNISELKCLKGFFQTPYQWRNK